MENNSTAGNDLIAASMDSSKNVVVGKQNEQNVSETAPSYGSNAVTFNQDGSALQIFQILQELRFQMTDFKQQVSLGLSELKQQMYMQASATNDKLDMLGRRVSILEQGDLARNTDMTQLKHDGVTRERQLRDLNGRITEYMDRNPLTWVSRNQASFFLLVVVVALITGAIIGQVIR